MPQVSYEDGVKSALEAFGLHRRMPGGRGHEGAERFSKLLESRPVDLPTSARSGQARRLDRPTRWGRPVPFDSGSQATQMFSGAGQFGGV